MATEKRESPNVLPAGEFVPSFGEPTGGRCEGCGREERVGDEGWESRDMLDWCSDCFVEDDGPTIQPHQPPLREAVEGVVAELERRAQRADKIEAPSHRHWARGNAWGLREGVDLLRKTLDQHRVEGDAGGLKLAVGLELAKARGVCPVCEGYGEGEYDDEGDQVWCLGCHDGQHFPPERLGELDDGEPAGSWLAFELIHGPNPAGAYVEGPPRPSPEATREIVEAATQHPPQQGGELSPADRGRLKSAFLNAAAADDASPLMVLAAEAWLDDALEDAFLTNESQQHPVEGKG